VSESVFTVSVSLMNAELLSFHPDERDFVLLGHDFEKRLDAEYIYQDITPYSFARAIGNPVKNDIFNALLRQSPLTATELSTQLRLSRNELSYNIKEMLESRLLVAEPKDKRTNQYHLDYDFMRVVSRQLIAYP